MSDEQPLQILFLQGIPASGKTTWAKDFIRRNAGWVRVNRDDIREMHGIEWSRKQEVVTKSARDMLMVDALINGFNIVVDDTNFGSTVQEAVASIRELLPHGPQFTYEVKRFDVPLAIALDRNRGRAKPVPEQVIRLMHRKHVQERERVAYRSRRANMPEVVMCDIDGTLALKAPERDIYDGDKAHLDQVHGPVWDLVDMVRQHYKLVFLSGRDEKFRAVTQRWLDKHGLSGYPLHMRPENDRRKDYIVKRELFEQYVEPHYDVAFCLDDRNQCVELWRGMGIPCFQVQNGDF